MKVSLDASTLAEAASWAARTLPSRPIAPALGGLLLEAGEGLSLSAFDYDVSSRARLSADVAEPGKVLVPGKLFAQVCATLPDRPVTLAVAGQEVELRCGPAEFMLQALPVEDYPTLPTPPEPLGFADAHLLREAFGQVVLAADPDNALIALTGVRLDIDDEGLHLAATNTHRLAVRTLPFQPALPTTVHGALVYAKVIQDLARALPNAGGVEFGISDSLFSASFAGRSVTARLLDDECKDYRTYLTKVPFPFTVTLDVAPFTDAVKRVSTLVAAMEPLRLEFTPDEVRLRGGDGVRGRGSEAVACRLEGADEVQVAFQAPYLLDGLRGVQGDVATIGITERKMQALITGEGSYAYMVQALRV